MLAVQWTYTRIQFMRHCLATNTYEWVSEQTENSYVTRWTSSRSWTATTSKTSWRPRTPASPSPRSSGRRGPARGRARCRWSRCRSTPPRPRWRCRRPWRSRRSRTIRMQFRLSLLTSASRPPRRSRPPRPSPLPPLSSPSRGSRRPTPSCSPRPRPW